jgi:hypothetical protein
MRLLQLPSECKEFVHEVGLATACVLPARGVVSRFPKDYRDDILQLPLTGYDHTDRKFVKWTLKDYTHGSLGRQKLLIIVGCSGGFKTTLAQAMARWFCMGSERSTFVLTDSYDNLGVLTKSGTLSRQGCIIFDDAAWVSNRDQPLKELDMINIASLEKPAGYNARYGAAQMPKEVPRIITMNLFGDDWGGNMKFEGLKHLVNESIAGMADLHRLGLERDIGIARRCVVLRVPTPDYLGAKLRQMAETLDQTVAQYTERAERLCAMMDTD